MRWLEQLFFGRTFNVRPGPPRDVMGLQLTVWGVIPQLQRGDTGIRAQDKGAFTDELFLYSYKLYKHVSASIVDKRPVRISDAQCT